MLSHEYTYAYAAVEPTTSIMSALILPQVNTECMQLFMDTVAQRHPSENKLCTKICLKFGTLINILRG